MESTDPEAHTLLAGDSAAPVAPDGETIDKDSATEIGDGPGGKRRRRRKHFAVLPRGSALGRYVVLDQLGAGGMGVVYAAFDPELDRRVAIKLLQTDEDAGEDATAGHARLLREAQAMARLTHPNVIAVYDVGSLGNSVFVAMEFVAGVTLTKHFKKQWENGEPDWRETVAIYTAAARGLAAAHAAGVIHRDFKPDNVMLGDDGRVLVLDFGLARPTGDGPSLGSSASFANAEVSEAMMSSASGVLNTPMSAQLTKTGSVMGTPAYMSPEQMMGRRTSGATDQFSLCVALYQALYNERPFAGEAFADLTSHVLRGKVRDAPRGTKVPTWVRRVLLQGLQRKPTDRFPTMSILIAALQHDPRQRRVRAAMGVGAVALLAGAVAAGVRVGKTDDPCAEAGVAVDSVWNAERAAAVESSFAEVGKAFADESYRRLTPLLDDYAKRWRSQRTEACQATRVRGEQSDAVMSLRTTCLDRRLARLGALVDLLLEADARIATDALSSAHALPDLELCADVGALQSEVPPPDDPERRKLAAELAVDIDRTIALAAAGRYKDAPELFDELLARAEALEYEPIIAEVEAAYAELEINMGRGKEARRHVMRSILLAEATGHDRVIAGSLINLAEIEGSALNDFESARERLDRAEAVIRRRGNPLKNRISLLSARGKINRAADDWDAAVGHYEAAWKLRVDAGLDDTPEALVQLNAMGMGYVRLGKLDRAREVGDQALELGTRLLGSGHPNVGVTLAMRGRLAAARNKNEAAIGYFRRARSNFVNALGTRHSNVAAMDNNLGLSLRSLGRFEEALAAYESAMEITKAARGPEHLDVSAVLTNVGALLRVLDRGREAVAAHEASMAIKVKVIGPEHQDVGFLHDMLGDDHLSLGELDQALAHYNKSLAMFDQLGGADDTRLAYPLAGIGMVYLAQDDPARARPVLERALRLDEKDDAGADEAARAAFPLAKALAATGELARARTLALLAKKGWELEPAGHVRELNEVNAWLQAHPGESSSQ